jgi:hypothetical protein
MIRSRPRGAIAVLAAVACAAALAAAQPAAAQATFLINSGVTIPSGDLGKYQTTGLHLTGTIDFGIADHLAVGFRLGGHWLPLDDTALLEDAGFPEFGYAVQGGTGVVIVALGTVRAFMPLGSGQLYGIGGAGYMIRANNDLTIDTPGGAVDLEGGSETGPGIQLGAGYRIPVHETAGFVEVATTVGFTDPVTTATSVRLGLAVPVGRR